MTSRVLWVALVACSESGESPLPTIADLQVEVPMQAPATADPLQLIDYRMVVTNHGPEVAQGVVVRHEVTDHAFLGEVIPLAGCVHMNIAVTCTLGSIEPGGFRELEILGRASELVGPFQSITEVTAKSDDPDVSNNAVTQATTVIENAELSIAFSGDYTAPPNQTLFHSVDIVNNGPTLAHDIRVRIENLDGLQIEQSSNPDFLCDTGQAVRTCEVPRLPVGTFNITIGTMGQGPGTYRFRATLATTSPEDDPDNNVTFQTVTLQ